MFENENRLSITVGRDYVVQMEKKNSKVKKLEE